VCGGVGRVFFVTYLDCIWALFFFCLLETCLQLCECYNGPGQRYKGDLSGFRNVDAV
jgi:hypothetical protein